MKVAVYYSNDNIKIEEQPVPKISSGEILVKMKASGICGTDVMQWYRSKKAPRILGHEMAGDIVAVSSGVDKLKNGQRVFVSHHVPCYKCRHCAYGNFTACEALHSGNFYPGGFSEFIRIPEQNVRFGTLLLPQETGYNEATMIEPLGCVIAGQNQLDIKKGHTVLVIGSGVSGLLHIQLAKSKKAKVIAIDVNDFKLKKALDFGADLALKADKYSASKLKTINDNRLADIVIVCASADPAVKTALLSVNRKGKLLFFAVPENDIVIPSLDFWRNEIAVLFSYGASSDDLKEALELIKNKEINALDMITHRLPLSDIQKGFRLASDGKNSLKVVLVPDQ